MQELIDRQETLKKMCETCGYCERFEKAMRSTHPDFVTEKCNTYKFLAEQPTIEAKPVRYGQWDNGKCTNCKRNLLELCGGEDYELAMYAEYDADFCPFCGARMDAPLPEPPKDDNNAELKPCPFCDGKAELHQEDFDPYWMPTPNDPDSGGCPPYYVKCNDCGANTKHRYDYPDAVKLWNRRTNNG